MGKHLILDALVGLTGLREFCPTQNACPGSTESMKETRGSCTAMLVFKEIAATDAGHVALWALLEACERNLELPFT